MKEGKNRRNHRSDHSELPGNERIRPSPISRPPSSLRGWRLGLCVKEARNGWLGEGGGEETND